MERIPTPLPAQLTPSQGSGLSRLPPWQGVSWDRGGIWGEECSFPATGSLCIHRDPSPPGSTERGGDAQLKGRVDPIPSPSPAFPSRKTAVPALRWQRCPPLTLSVPLTPAFPRTFLAPAFPSSPPTLLPAAVPWPLALANLSRAGSTLVLPKKAQPGGGVVPAGGKPQSQAVPQFPQASARGDARWPRRGTPQCFKAEFPSRRLIRSIKRSLQLSFSHPPAFSNRSCS